MYVHIIDFGLGTVHLCGRQRFYCAVSVLSEYLCAVLNGSNITTSDIVQSTGAYSLGWMGMYAIVSGSPFTAIFTVLIRRGFGDTMANSPMVVMWPNSDGTITLSQRETTAEVMPTVVSDPPRIATLSMSLSSVSCTYQKRLDKIRTDLLQTSGTQPKLAYTIPVSRWRAKCARLIILL